jgi:hypothetical protein
MGGGYRGFEWQSFKVSEFQGFKVTGRSVGGFFVTTPALKNLDSLKR